MKKIIIIDSYSLNTGDLAILSSLLNGLKSMIPEIALTIESSHPTFLKEKFKIEDKYKIVSRIFDIEKIVKTDGVDKSKKNIILGIYDSSSFIVFALILRLFKIKVFSIIRKSRKLDLEKMIEIDFVISTGGGFLSTNYNYIFRLVSYCFYLILNKPIYSIAQSIGPFDSKISKILIPFFIKKFDLLTVRENWTKEYLENFGIHPILTADLAFNLDKGELSKKKQVSICVKKDNDSIKNEIYKRKIIEVSNFLISENYEIKLVSQTPNDDKLAVELSKILGEKSEPFMFGISPENVKQIYAESHFVISSRMHAIIFSVESFVPIIALSYEPKFYGLFKEMKYPLDYIIDERELEKTDLLNISKKIISNRDKLIDHLSKVIPEIKINSLKNIELIKNKIYGK